MNPLKLPVVAAQAVLLRARTERIPPASGPTQGTIPPPADSTADPAQPLRIGIVGESTAAGCGVQTHEQGFPGALARALAARTSRAVEWTVVGQDAATARRIRHRLLPQLEGSFDIAVVLAGVNDVLSRRPAQEWNDDLVAILDDLSTRAGQTIVAGIPPFDAFPSIPSLLGQYLAERAADLDAVSQQVCATRPATAWLDAKTLLPVGEDFLSRDRFHPSAYGYQRWARAVAALTAS